MKETFSQRVENRINSQRYGVQVFVHEMVIQFINKVKKGSFMCLLKLFLEIELAFAVEWRNLGHQKRVRVCVLITLWINQKVNSLNRVLTIMISKDFTVSICLKHQCF